MTTALTLQQLSVSLGGRRVVRDVSLDVAHGEWVALVGPNGAGKTSVLRAIAGLISCTGEVLIDGAGIAGLDRGRLARSVALVPQRPQIPPEFTVAEYVLLGRTPHIGYLGTEGRHDREAAQLAIERLALEPFVSRRLGEISGGELQRAVLARALAQEAPLLLLDEPTTALDLGGQQRALELIDSLRREVGLTVVSTSHDLSLAGQYADRLMLLDRGEVVAEGPASEVLTENTIARYYGADVRVMRLGDDVFVLPRRAHQDTAMSPPA
jgi:iron complex transport system ATP-binding protein